MTSQPAPLDEETATAIAVQLILTMMSSVPRNTIDPRRWWTRAKSALSTSAERSYSWGQMVSTMAESLQIPVLRKRSAKAISLIGRAVNSDSAAFESFRALAERDAVFLVAMAQAERDRQREAGGVTMTPELAQKLHFGIDDWINPFDDDTEEVPF